MLSSKNNILYKKENENVCFYSWDYIINHGENDDEKKKKNRSHRQDINRTRSGHAENIRIFSVWWLYVLHNT